MIRRFSFRSFSLLLAFGAASSLAHAQAPQTSVAASSTIGINIDGRNISSDPAPLLVKGSVYVPLRGVLENLGAVVNYNAAQNRIDITQNGVVTTLRAGVAGATVAGKAVTVPASRVVSGRAFVPLRALAELFGYRVEWLAPTRIVAIYSGAAVGRVVDHRAELAKAGSFGLNIDFSRFSPDEVPALLDAAKLSGAGLVKTRFDWPLLEPTKDAPFQWALYDRVVKEARDRQITLVGQFGDTPMWAANYAGTDPNIARRSPVKDEFLPKWSNYVSRVTGRYKSDVQAWQVWTNPNTSNWLSVGRNYRKIARAAIDAARVADPKAIVHVAEPGGVDLDFLADLNANGLTPLADGVSVYPVSGWQPGTLASPEAFLRPYTLLRTTLRPDAKTRDHWAGGLSFPVASAVPGVAATDFQTTSLALYTPEAQAAYLVKISALALAAGTDKVFWSTLRDAPDAPARDGVVLNTGLQDTAGAPRPAFGAYQTLTRSIGAKPYAGQLSASSDAVVLVFDDKQTGVAVAWSPSGNGSLTMNDEGVDPNVAGATFLATRADSQVLRANGSLLAPAGGALRLTAEPVFITNIAAGAAEAARARGTERLAQIEGTNRFANAEEVRAIFGPNGGENGIAWRGYLSYGGSANKISTSGDRAGLITQAQRNIWDLRSSKPFIYLDVADEWAYNTPAEPITLSVEVKRPPVPTGSIFDASSGFRVEYDGINGDKTTPWQVVEPGEGWATYNFVLRDAQLANSNGYDLLINVGGSKTDMTFGAVTLRRGEVVAPVVTP